MELLYQNSPCNNKIPSIPEAIKNKRLRLNMTQKELAEAVDVSRQTINMIEKGEYNPTIKLCCAICRALDKTLDDLFWEEDE